MITATSEKKALEKLNSIRRTKVRTHKKAKKRFCYHHHQLRSSGSALCVVAVTQIQHQVNPGFNVASVKDGHIMYAAVLTWSIFVKTVLKTIKIEQYLIESKTLHHFFRVLFSIVLWMCITFYSFVFLLIFVCTALFFIALCLYSFVF